MTPEQCEKSYKVELDLLREIGEELEPVEYLGSYAEGIRALKWQLAECQAREMIQMDALAVWDSLMAYQYTGTRPAMTALQQAFDKGASALAMPSDTTALDAMLKQAKREAKLEAAHRHNTKP